MIEDEDVISVFMKDLGCLMKQFKNTVGDVKLECNFKTNEQLQNHFVSELEKVLVSFRVIDLILRMTDSKHFLTILQYADAKILKNLKLINPSSCLTTLYLTEMMKMDHWKNLEEILTFNFFDNRTSQ